MSLDRTFRVKAFALLCALSIAFAAGWWTGRMM